MGEFDGIITTIVDSSTGGFISWLADKAKTSALYQDIQKKINPEGHISSIKNIIETSTNLAVRNLPNEFDKKIIRENLKLNFDNIGGD